MRKLLLLFSVLALMSCEEKQDWLVTIKTTIIQRNSSWDVVSKKETSVDKTYLGYSEKRVSEICDGLCEYSQEKYGSVTYQRNVSATYKEL